MRRYNDEEDAVILRHIENNPDNLSLSFRLAAEELGRTKGSVSSRWYGALANPNHHKCVGLTFLTLAKKRDCVEDKEVLTVNRNTTLSEKRTLLGRLMDKVRQLWRSI